MSDAFQRHDAGLDSPYDHSEPITPSDSADLSNATRAIYVGTTGALHFATTAGTEDTLPSMPVGIHRLRVCRVYSTGTTASNLHALW